MCPADNATAGSWAGVGLVTEIWICCGIGGTYKKYVHRVDFRGGGGWVQSVMVGGWVVGNLMLW
jgi:hypothetical protein